MKFLDRFRLEFPKPKLRKVGEIWYCSEWMELVGGLLEYVPPYGCGCSPEVAYAAWKHGFERGLLLRPRRPAPALIGLPAIDPDLLDTSMEAA